MRQEFFRVYFEYDSKPSFFSKFAKSLSALATVPPFVARPDKTFAVGHSFDVALTASQAATLMGAIGNYGRSREIVRFQKRKYRHRHG